MNLDLTPAQRRVLEALVQYGTLKEGAYAVGVAQRTAEKHLADAKARNGDITTAQLCFLLGLETR